MLPAASRRRLFARRNAIPTALIHNTRYKDFKPRFEYLTEVAVDQQRIPTDHRQDLRGVVRAAFTPRDGTS
jgi:hypothetical protein